MGEANDTNGHPSQESYVTVDAENSNIDELDIIYDSSKTIDKNVEQTEVSQKVLPVQSAHESEEVNTFHKATDVNGDSSKDSDHTINAENMTVDEPDCILDSVEVNTVGKEKYVHGHCSQEISVQIDMENSNIDEPNIHDSSKTNDANAEQTNSIVDYVEQNDVFQNIIQGLQNKTICKDVGMEKADETTSDLGKDLSIQGGVEMNNATSLDGSSVILGEQNIVQDGVTFIQDMLALVDFNNDEDQTSNSEEFKWNDDGGGGSTDAKHIKKSNKKFRIVAIENDDDRSESFESDNSRFSQISSIEPQGEPELQQLSRLSSFNSEECSSATAIDVSIKNTNEKKPKEGNQIKDKDMAMLVFNPYIMVFLPLFNVIMLTLTILMRKH